MKIKSKAEMVSALMFYLHVLVYIDFLNDFSNVWGSLLFTLRIYTVIDSSDVTDQEIVWVCIYQKYKIQQLEFKWVTALAYVFLSSEKKHDWYEFSPYMVPGMG